MWPRIGSAGKLVSRWIVLTLILSIGASIDGGWLSRWTALVPSRVFRGELWRLVTWALVEAGPISLAVTCIAIYKFGGELSIRWGDRRLLRFMGGIVIAASVAGVVVWALTGIPVARLGGWVVTDVLVIAWARQFPQAMLVLYGMLPLSGRALIRVTIGITILYAIFLGVIWLVPELVACGIAASYRREWLRR
jgi:membrane associated rhomboid family serine protease